MNSNLIISGTLTKAHNILFYIYILSLVVGGMRDISKNNHLENGKSQKTKPQPKNRKTIFVDVSVRTPRRSTSEPFNNIFLFLPSYGSLTSFLYVYERITYLDYTFL